ITGYDLLLADPPALRVGQDFNNPVTVATSNRPRPQLTLAWQRDGIWRTATRSDLQFAGRATASVTLDGGVVVLIYAGLRDGPPGVYAFRAEWKDSVVWSSPILVDSVRSSFSDAALARLGGDTLLSVWYQPAVGLISLRGIPETTPARGMITALSIDGGRDWSLQQPLVPTSGMDGQVLAVDATGSLHMVYRRAPHENILNEPGAVMHATWHNGAWSTPAPVS